MKVVVVARVARRAGCDFPHFSRNPRDGKRLGGWKRDVCVGPRKSRPLFVRRYCSLYSSISRQSFSFVPSDRAWKEREGGAGDGGQVLCLVRLNGQRCGRAGSREPGVVFFWFARVGTGLWYIYQLRRSSHRIALGTTRPKVVVCSTGAAVKREVRGRERERAREIIVGG